MKNSSVCHDETPHNMSLIYCTENLVHVLGKNYGINKLVDIIPSLYVDIFAFLK